MSPFHFAHQQSDSESDADGGDAAEDGAEDDETEGYRHLLDLQFIFEFFNPFLHSGDLSILSFWVHTLNLLDE